ncbi:hypothetical protein DL96DRAFT_1638086 [Flagelloscypha sp. PMI_526]|nr:hypothetical protein DL96DRAFT_1638086 [Flagelloscypha sp. PMI_526]
MDSKTANSFAHPKTKDFEHEDVTLPPELIECIVQFQTNQRTLRNLSLVSRAFHHCAQSKIFAIVVISKSLTSLSRSGYSKPLVYTPERAVQHFTSFPHLTKFVRTLVVFGRLMAPVLRLFYHIENLFLFDTGTWTESPEESRHLLERTFPQLKVLSLRNVTLFPFDSISKSCTSIQHITLDNVSASEVTSIQESSAIPLALPCLESLKFLNYTSPDLFKKGTFLSLFHSRVTNLRTLHLPSFWESSLEVHIPLLQRFGGSLVHIQFQSLPKTKDIHVGLEMHLNSLPQLRSISFRLPRYIPGFPLEIRKMWLFSLFELTQRHPLQMVEIRASAFSSTLPHPKFIAEFRGHLKHGLFFNRPTLTVVCEKMVTSNNHNYEATLGKLTKFEFQQND